MKRLFLYLYFIICVSSGAYAQGAALAARFDDKVLASFMNYYDRGIDEKLYLQTDKPYYSAGENVWFKGFLLNSITHVNLEFSNYIYVELIDSSTKLVSRVKVKRVDNSFDGYIGLDAKLAPGDYMLRAYTRWMTNNSADFFFTKNIKIVSPIPEDAKGDDRQVAPSARSVRQAQRGNDKFDVQFFPESGNLIAGQNQIVAFKAVGVDGLGVDISGTLYNQDDEPLGEISSSHKGMGRINMVSERDASYYAIVTAEGSQPRRFDLPQVQESGLALKVSRVADRLFYQAQSTSSRLLKGANLVVQSRGRIMSIIPIEDSKPGYFPYNQLYEGVSVLSLVDADGRVVAERVVFRKPQNLLSLELQTDKDNYGARRNASCSVVVRDVDGNPVVGDFAVAVTDNSSVSLDASADNIVSYLLLSSEIRGHIEQPADYFTDDVSADINLDLLMLTQGWRRFATQDVLDNTLEARTVAYETAPEIAGEVRGFFGNAARKPKLFILCQKLDFADVRVLDSSNRFLLVDLDLPDSSTYILQAVGRNGGGSLELKIEPEVFPQMPVNLMYAKPAEEYIPESFVLQSQDKFYYDGGMKMIELDAVAVTTAAKVSPYAATSATRSVDSEQLERMAGMPLVTILQTFPSMTITDTGIKHRSGPGMVRYMVDGMDEDFEYVCMLSTDDVQQVDFLSGADAAMFANAGSGIFYIVLKEGVRAGARPDKLNIARVSPLGYQRAQQFYQPKYDNPSVLRNSPPDYRTTIYWNGSLRTDSLGVANFDFFTADKATDYTITIEGVGAQGQLGRSTSVIKRTLSK